MKTYEEWKEEIGGEIKALLGLKRWSVRCERALLFLEGKPIPPETIPQYQAYEPIPEDARLEIINTCDRMYPDRCNRAPIYSAKIIGADYWGHNVTWIIAYKPGWQENGQNAPTRLEIK